MGGNNVAVHIISRVLYRSEFFDIPADGKNNDSSRVLPCGTADTGAPLHNPVNLAVTLSLPPFLIIFFHISESCFLCQRTDCSRLKSLSCAENNLYIAVGFSLIIPGKVQVNIRFLISFKSQEGFKRNVKSLFNQRLSTHRTLLIRHVAARSSRISPHFLRIEVRVMAFRAIIMRA